MELLETYAEISIRDAEARKKFTLVVRTPGMGSGDLVWVPLTLEPGQAITRFSGPTKEGSNPRDVSLGIRGTAGGTSKVELETVEQLQPERGRYRVETLNAFLLADLSVLLQRRTVVARIESSRPLTRVFSPTHPVSVVHHGPREATLTLDVSGLRAAGRFRFFYSFGDASQDDLRESDPVSLTAGLPGAGRRLSGGRDEFLELRRNRPRRSRSLRRLP